jgi:hypothetical protein
LLGIKEEKKTLQKKIWKGKGKERKLRKFTGFEIRPIPIESKKPKLPIQRQILGKSAKVKKIKGGYIIQHSWN